MSKQIFSADMSKQLFSAEQIDQLQKNLYKLKLNERTITYADAIKSQFIDEYLAGENLDKY